MEMRKEILIKQKIIRASLPRLFWQTIVFGTNLKEKLLFLPTRQSSTLEFMRIMDEIISSSGKLYEAARK